MKLRELGNTGTAVSEIGFGAWAIGADWGEVAEDQAMQALHTAIDHGVNFIDTADVYGNGRSEQLVGRLLRERDETIFVATKMGRLDDWDDSYDSMAAAAQASCERLGVDTLDLVQLHCIPFQTIKAGHVFANLEKLKSAGLIMNYGASVETVEEALFCIHNSGCSILQVIFNIFRQKLIDDLFPAVRESGIGIIARLPLASGLLTGKYPATHQFPDDDHRNFNANGECFNVGETFAGVPFPTGVELAAEIADITNSNEPGQLSSLALRWILDFPEVSTVIPGSKSAAQSVANCQAANLPALDSNIHKRLREFYHDRVASEIRGAY